MNIETISSVKLPPDSRGSPVSLEPQVINLDEIKTILYLGVKGRIYASGAESHRVDTFA